MEEELKKVDIEIQEILKKYNCTLTVNHVISINKLKPKDGPRTNKKNTK